MNALAGTLAPRRIVTRSTGPHRRSPGTATLASTLAALSQHGVLALHDRRLPGRRSGFDHLAVGPAGVFVIDEKRTESTEPWAVQTSTIGGFINDEKVQLLVQGEPRDQLVTWVQSRVQAVREALAPLEGELADVLVVPVLCFDGATLPRRQKRLWVGDAAVIAPAGLTSLLRARGRLDAPARERILDALAEAFPPA